MGLSRNGTGYPQYTMSLGTMMLNQRIPGYPPFDGRSVSRNERIGHVRHFRTKGGVKEGEAKCETSLTRLFYSFDVEGLS